MKWINLEGLDRIEKTAWIATVVVGTSGTVVLACGVLALVASTLRFIF